MKIFLMIMSTFFVIICSGSVTALTFDVLPTIDKAAAEASLAFRGRVEKLSYSTTQVSAVQSIPYTNIHMAVDEVFGGVDKPTMTLRQIGGKLPNNSSRYLVIPGLIDLAPSEEVYVLANDRMQPFFATLYGDYTLFRIARDENMQTLVLNAHWQPLHTNGKKIWPLQGIYCVPDSADRSLCRHITRDVGDVSETHDVEPRSGNPLTVKNFDQFIRRWRANTDVNQIGQTVSAQEASFAAALSDFGSTVSAPSDINNGVVIGEKQ